MKSLIGSVAAAGAASVCCIGPVVGLLAGAGTLGAAAAGFEPYRPYLVALTLVLLGFAFHATYRPPRDACATGGTCAPVPRRSARTGLWVATVMVLLLLAFPYYVGWLI